MYTKSGHIDKETLLKQYQPLVIKIAHHLKFRLPANIEVDDLIQVGMIGLYDSIGRYSDEHNVKFETFASQRIRGAMLDDLRENDVMSRHCRVNQKEIAAAKCQLSNQLGRTPKDTEMAQKLGIPLTEYQALERKIHEMQIVSVEDLSCGQDDDGNFLDFYQDPQETDPQSELREKRMRMALIDAINILPVREQQIMSLYYEQDMNLKEIALALSLTEARISQILSKIYGILKKAMRNH